MIKLLRSTLGDYKKIVDPKRGQIEWRYFEKLVEYREKNNLITHKMNKHHILYWKNKMNVRLAVQVFSNATAASMNLLRESGDRNFRNSKATSYFTSSMNTLFDVFNTKSMKQNSRLKVP